MPNVEKELAMLEDMMFGWNLMRTCRKTLPILPYLDVRRKFKHDVFLCFLPFETAQSLTDSYFSCKTFFMYVYNINFEHMIIQI